MADFQHPLLGLMQGFQGGANLALTVDQTKRQRQQQEWENDYRLISTGLQLAGVKNNTPQTTSDILNRIGPIWAKRSGTEWKPIAPEEAPDFMKEAGQNIIGLNEAASKGDIPYSHAYSESNKHIASWHSKKRNEAEVSEREKATIDSLMAPIKGGYDAEQEKKKAGAKAAPTPQDALKEMFDIQKSLASEGRIDPMMAFALSQDPELAKREDLIKTSPEDMASMKAAGAKRIEYLNQFVPEAQRLQKINDAEYEHLLKVKGWKPEQIFQKYYVVPSSVK